MPEDFGFEIEEIDLEYEQLKEIEAESKLVDDEDRDSLRGLRLVFNEPFTGRQSTGVTDETVRSEMKKKDMWRIPSEHRGPVYRHMQQALKAAITKKFRELACQYQGASKDAKIGLWEMDYHYLKQAKVIGMTTTGLSKYRGLLQSLNPKVVLIEEAAEYVHFEAHPSHFTMKLSRKRFYRSKRGFYSQDFTCNYTFYPDVAMLTQFA